eukprot:46656-Eustigmatos_ZCMA.PRE.1
MTQIEKSCSTCVGEEVRFFHDNGTVMDSASVEKTLATFGDEKLTRAVGHLRDCLEHEGEALADYLYRD